MLRLFGISTFTKPTLNANHRKVSTMYVKRDKEGIIVEIKMLRPSNFHAHLRLEHLMRAIAFAVMHAVKYLLVMPNDGVIDTIEKLKARYQELRALADQHGLQTTFVMTVYLTKNVTPRVIEQLKRLPFRVEVKYYPPEQGATTGSGYGIPLPEAADTLRTMAEYKVPLLGHFEAVHDEAGRLLPPEQRETHFMQAHYPRLRDAHPALPISIEHASTIETVIRVQEDPSGNTVVTFTPHHLLLPIDEIRRLSWANFARCMPIPKGPEDVAACLEFATSGDPRVIAGDDTAAHLRRTKLGAFEDAANGAFWTSHAIAAYALAFERQGALVDNRLEDFMSRNGARWRGLELPDESDIIVLRRDDKRDIPNPIPVPEADDVVVPIGWTEAPDRLRLGLVVD